MSETRKYRGFDAKLVEVRVVVERIEELARVMELRAKEQAEVTRVVPGPPPEKD